MPCGGRDGIIPCGGCDGIIPCGGCDGINPCGGREGINPRGCDGIKFCIVLVGTRLVVSKVPLETKSNRPSLVDAPWGSAIVDCTHVDKMHNEQHIECIEACLPPR